jgi:hypothetical protein
VVLAKQAMILGIAEGEDEPDEDQAVVKTSLLVAWASPQVAG